METQRKAIRIKNHLRCGVICGTALSQSSCSTVWTHWRWYALRVKRTRRQSTVHLHHIWRQVIQLPKKKRRKLPYTNIRQDAVKGRMPVLSHKLLLPNVEIFFNQYYFHFGSGIRRLLRLIYYRGHLLATTLIAMTDLSGFLISPIP